MKKKNKECEQCGEGQMRRMTEEEYEAAVVDWDMENAPLKGWICEECGYEL